MKKAFCSVFFYDTSVKKSLTSDLSYSRVTSVDKREPQGTFLSLGLRPRLQKTFPWFLFFYLCFENLLLAALFQLQWLGGKTNDTWNIFHESSQDNYSNKIIFLLQRMLRLLHWYIWWTRFFWYWWIKRANARSTELCGWRHISTPRIWL